MNNLKYKRGDLIHEFKKGTVNAIIHQCNCHCVMGAGIAKRIKEEFPEAYKADLETSRTHQKLGKYSFVTNKYGYIVNLYSQNWYGHTKRQTDYEAFYKGFSRIIKEFKNPLINFGIPHGIGCGLAGGNWNIVHTMIQEIMKENPEKTAWIVQLPTS